MSKPSDSSCSLESDANELYEHAPCGYISLKPDGCFVRANQTFLEWLGYEAEALIGKMRFQDLLSIGERIFYETHFSPLLQMQKFANELNFSIQRSDGTRFPSLVSAKLIQDGAGKPVTIRLALFPVMDRKKYESELLLERKKAEQALRGKSDFVSLLTHEIRTPLNSIIGASHLLADTELSSEQKRYSEMLSSSSENLMSLLNSILDYSKIDAGKSRIEERTFEFERTIRTTALAFQAPAIRKGITLSIEVSDQIPAFLWGDAVKIGQMVTNLVGNAIKFTQKGSVTLNVSVEREDPEWVHLQFKVIDTGIGIPEDIIPKIFEEYSQADDNTGATYGGTGLGLAIVHQLAALHGSKINVASIVGKGSTFSFSLRLRKADKPSSIGANEIQIDNSLAGLRILVADDSEDNQDIIELVLGRWGIAATRAANGREVLEQVQAHDFNLILMDLRMPVLDGYATTAEIRKLSDKYIASVPIIAFSASATLGDEDIVSNLKFQGILGKPYNPTELFEKISKLARRPQNR